MSLSIVQTGSALVGSGPCDVVLGDTANGNTLIAVVTWNSATATLSSVTCTGATFSLIAGTDAGPIPPQNSNRAVMRAVGITAATAPTVEATLSGSFTHLRMRVYEANGDTHLIDNVGTNTGSSNQVTVSVTTSETNAPIFGCAINQINQLSAIGNGYTQTSDNINDFSTNFYNVNTTGAPGTQTVSFPFVSDTGNWNAVAFSFKSPPPPPLPVELSDGCRIFVMP